MGIIERWWSPKGSLKDGIISMDGKAGFLPEVLRGGIHVKPGLMYKVHTYPLITIPQGKIGYVFARSGEVLPNTQILGKIIPESNNFQDVKGFLDNGGQKGPQRGILREGTYALNLAQFVVITEGNIYYLPVGDSSEKAMYEKTRDELSARNGFDPIVIKGSNTVTQETNTPINKTGDVEHTSDLVGIVTVLDGPSLPNGDIIAPIVGDEKSDKNYHNNFQDPEKFLSAGGYKGRQLQVLTEGSYMINRLFATVEFVPKTVIPVGYVGVIVSYTGNKGNDVTGEDYKHGELVKNGCRGVWADPLTPGKYALNTYAVECKLVPTTNLILKWASNEIGDHRLDRDLSEIELITQDAFQPLLPLSVVLHIDYRMAPFVIQRFGDMEKLVTQTLDPLIASYFKNIGQTKTVLELIQDRSNIQQSSTEDMKLKFQKYNLELEEVLIGTPQSSVNDKQIDIMLDQLRKRQVAIEQTKTFESQQRAAEKQKDLEEAKAVAEQQSALTGSEINIKIETNKGEAEAKRAEQQANQTRTIADAEAYKIKKTAEAEAEKIQKTGTAEADAIKAQSEAYGNPQYQLVEKVMNRFSTAIETSGVNIVPSTVVNMAGGQNNGNQNVFESLLGTLLMKELGVKVKPNSEKPEKEKENN